MFFSYYFVIMSSYAFVALVDETLEGKKYSNHSLQMTIAALYYLFFFAFEATIVLHKEQAE